MNPILILARLTLPLLILKYPLIGGVIAISLDSIDWDTKYIFNLQPFGEYQRIDKLLDLYYLSLLAIVARRFTDTLVRNVILGLFFYRLIGVILFEITSIRFLLVLFPNVFEYSFFFYYIVIKIATYTPKISSFTLFWMLVIISIPTILHEYIIHIIERSLIVTIGDISIQYHGRWDQILFFFILAILTGLYYKNNKKNN